MSRRDQIRMSDDEVAAFLSSGHTMNVATHNHDGTIHLVAMWYAMDGTDPVFWTYGKSQKIRNIERDPRITCLVETGEVYAELKGVEIVGTASVVTDRDAVMAIGESVYSRYFGEVTDEVRPFVELTGAKRFAVRIRPERIVSWDHSKLDGTY